MGKIREKVKKVSLGWNHALLNYFDVYSPDGIIVGKGYIISYPDGWMSRPELFDLNGASLPSAWYQMKLTEYRPCIVPEKVQ